MIINIHSNIRKCGQELFYKILLEVCEKYNREVFTYTANFFPGGVVFGSVVCTPPTRLLRPLIGGVL